MAGEGANGKAAEDTEKKQRSGSKQGGCCRRKRTAVRGDTAGTEVPVERGPAAVELSWARTSEQGSSGRVHCDRYRQGWDNMQETEG